MEWHAITKQPYVVYIRGHHIICFAGVHTTWVDPNSGENINSFGIITQEGNELMRKIGHHRQPLLLTLENYHRWLRADEFRDASTVLNTQLQTNYMNAYPIEATIVNYPANNTKEVIQPIGERILTEKEVNIKKEIKLFGMGQTAARMRRKKDEE
jgi:putative SOS response-associated peptidase YedK